MSDEPSNFQEPKKETVKPSKTYKSGLDDLDENGQKLPLEFLNDVPLKLTVELGNGKISIRELLQLGHGTVFELDKLAGEPLEVKINSRLISRGEVVVVNDRYAVRLTDVINPEEINS